MNKTLSLSQTWKQSDVPVLRVIPRRAPNLKDKLFLRKAITLKLSTETSVPCSQMMAGRRGPKCQCCKMVGRLRSITNDNNTAFCVGGTCKSNNVIYYVRCTLCKNFNERINEHHASFNKLIKRLASSQTSRFSPLDFEVDDETILGAHLSFEHNKRNVTDFNDIYTVDVSYHCNPSEIRSKEQQPNYHWSTK